MLKAAVIIILKRGNEILLFKRKHTGWADGDYTCPSGYIEATETPSEAAIREVKEEVGVDILTEELKLVHVDFVRAKIIDFCFVVEKWQGEPQLIQPDKSEALAWFDLDNLPENIAGHGAKILENIKNKINFLEVN